MEIDNYDPCFPPELHSYKSATGHESQGVEIHAISSNSLVQLIKSFLDSDKEILSVNLASKKRHPKVFCVLQEYLEINLETFEVLKHLEKWLSLAQYNISSFKEERTAEVINFGMLMGGNDPFSTLLKKFQDIYLKEIQFSGKLRLEKEKIYKELRESLARRKLCKWISITIAFTIALCTIAVSIFAAHPVAMAFGAATSLPILAAWKMIDKTWLQKIQKMVGKEGNVSSLVAGTHIAIDDLNSLLDVIEELGSARELIENLETKVEEVRSAMDLCIVNLRKEKSKILQSVIEFRSF